MNKTWPAHVIINFKVGLIFNAVTQFYPLQLKCIKQPSAGVVRCGFFPSPHPPRRVMKARASCVYVKGPRLVCRVYLYVSLPFIPPPHLFFYLFCKKIKLKKKPWPAKRNDEGARALLVMIRIIIPFEF